MEKIAKKCDNFYLKELKILIQNILFKILREIKKWYVFFQKMHFSSSYDVRKVQFFTIFVTFHPKSSF